MDRTIEEFVRSLALDAYLMRVDRFERRQLNRVARSDVEACTMPRAFDLLTLQLALIE